MLATDKQISYIFFLARKNGLSVTWLDSSWKRYTSMRQRSGKVEKVLGLLNVGEASKLIDELKS